jgi:hypothetical protein
MHGTLLAFLTLLFFLRVLGQALVAFLGVTWLPPMKQWFSGLVPYPILLVIQIFMLASMVKISADICRGQGFFAIPRPRWSRALVSFSALYAGAMIARYGLTMMFKPEMRWFGGTIPIFFHFVLAGFILVLGRYLDRTPRRRRPLSGSAKSNGLSRSRGKAGSLPGT